MPIETDDLPRHRASNDIIDIGRRYQLTAYDAAYAELARRESATLATFDDALRKCAKSFNVKVIPV